MNSKKYFWLSYITLLVGSCCMIASLLGQLIFSSFPYSAALAIASACFVILSIMLSVKRTMVYDREQLIVKILSEK